MLRFLSVRHLAVIDHLEVEFEPGLNVLSGETGAGKSLVVEAIALLIGGRASADLVRTGESMATVQAIFENPDGREWIVRREVSAQGRSRAFVNDALATTAALRDLGRELIELHGQHEHQSLLDPADHAGLLDAFAGAPEAVAEVAASFGAWRAATDALARTQLSDREKRARIELATFQIQEIERVAPAAGEDEVLQAERVVLANADRLSRWSQEALAALYDGDHAALPGLATVWRRVSDLAGLDARFQPYVDERDDLKARLEDLAFFLRRYAGDLDASPDRLQVVEDRLAALERLKRRFGPGLTDVVAKRRELAAELEALGAGEEQLARLEARARDAESVFSRTAIRLREIRTAAARALATRLESDLVSLAMPSCRLEVRVNPLSDSAQWSSSGMDAVEFFFSPNPGEDLRALSRIASGGELSRLMLALRLATDRDDRPRTMIFDEVDAGIGGEAADAVGARLQGLGRNQQVLCVTHLAPIAARAGTHFHIAKTASGGRTTTTIARLDGPGREGEIGRMLAGAAVSAQILASAKELITRGESENKTKHRGLAGPAAKAKGGRHGP